MKQTVFHERWQEAQTDDPREAVDGSQVIHGVFVPAIVIWELRRLGAPLESYTAGQLQAAVQACLYDEHLVDDAFGLNFLDMLNLSDEEKEQEDDDISHAAFRMHYSNVHGHDFHHGLNKKDDWFFHATSHAHEDEHHVHPA